MRKARGLLDRRHVRTHALFPLRLLFIAYPSFFRAGLAPQTCLLVRALPSSRGLQAHRIPGHTGLLS